MTDLSRWAEPASSTPTTGVVATLLAGHGPERNAVLMAVLVAVLAAVMLANSVLDPFPGERYAVFNRLSLWITGGLAGLAFLSLGLVLAGRRGGPLLLAGRLGLVAYGCGLVGAMSVIMGPGTGVDVLGTVCLVFAPALIFGRGERFGPAVSLAMSIGTALSLQLWLAGGAAPMIPIEAGFLSAVRHSVVLVAACIGLFVIALYRSAEAARALADREHERSESLLLNVLPRDVAGRLKGGGQLIADGADQVTVLFADICGFTRFASGRDPAEVVGVLNRLFSRFDHLCERHGVEKIKTIGDGYMAVAGLPATGPADARAAARLALDMMEAMQEMRRDLPELDLRVGLHTGPVVAGVIGRSKFAYDVWGDTVNTASRLESGGEAGTITLSATTLVALDGCFKCIHRGQRTLKGKGAVPVWSLEGPCPEGEDCSPDRDLITAA